MKNEHMYSFETARLYVFDWRQYTSDTNELAQAIQHITTVNVMKTLPPSWQSLDSDRDRKQWILEREKESICLAVCKKQKNEILGILLLSKPTTPNDKMDLRIGYLIAEQSWGLGFASEIIQGLCKNCNESHLVRSITGGVDPTNTGSIKVLTKNGFLKDMNESNSNTHFYTYICNT